MAVLGIIGGVHRILADKMRRIRYPVRARLLRARGISPRTHKISHIICSTRISESSGK